MTFQKFCFFSNYNVHDFDSSWINERRMIFYLLSTKTERIVLTVAENQLDLILMEIDVDLIVLFTS